MRARLLGITAVAWALALGGCVPEGVDHHHDHPEEGPEDVGAASAGLALGSLRYGCSTAGTEGISRQLIDEMMCLTDGRLVRFSHSNVTLTSSRVHPYLSPEGRTRLYRAADRVPVRINSALRTIAEQYVLWRGCSVAATPGRSNHETGRAIDVGNWSSINSVLVGSGFTHPLPSSDPVHYEAPGADLRYYSVLAFQRLWNANNPGDRIAEDGATGTQTLSRLARAPGEGFRIGRVCGACTPSTEICNGRDDDCDGLVDEGVKNACGACGPVPVEVCNGRDDDCDGLVDEDVCDHAAVSGDSLPSPLVLGTTTTLSLTFRNTGTTTWRPATHAIVARGTGAEVTLSGGIDGTVSPGGSVEVTATVVPVEEGEARVRIGVARDGRIFADAFDATAPTRRPAFAARVLDASFPESLRAGDRASAWVVLENAGSEAWPGGAVTLRSDADVPAFTGSVIGTVHDEVPPGGSVRLPVSLEAPAVRTEATFLERWVVARGEQISRWPEDGMTVRIAVRPASAEPLRAGPAADSRTVTASGCAAAGEPTAAPWWLLVLLLGSPRGRAVASRRSADRSPREVEP